MCDIPLNWHFCCICAKHFSCGSKHISNACIRFQLKLEYKRRSLMINWQMHTNNKQTNKFNTLVMMITARAIDTPSFQYYTIKTRRILLWLNIIGTVIRVLWFGKTKTRQTSDISTGSNTENRIFQNIFSCWWNWFHYHLVWTEWK